MAGMRVVRQQGTSAVVSRRGIRCQGCINLSEEHNTQDTSVQQASSPQGRSSPGAAHLKHGGARQDGSAGNTVVQQARQSRGDRQALKPVCSRGARSFRDVHQLLQALPQQAVELPSTGCPAPGSRRSAVPHRCLQKRVVRGPGAVALPLPAWRRLAVVRQLARHRQERVCVDAAHAE